MQTTKTLLLLLLISAFALSPAFAQDDATEIMKKSHMAYYYAGDDGIAEVTMTLVGLIFVIPIRGWPVVAILSLTGAPQAMGLGLLSWLVISEIFPTRLRALAMGICTIFLWASCWIIVRSAPTLFDWSTSVLGVPSGVFFLCALISALGFLFVFRRLPETKHRTLEEIAKSWK